jgi:hypothetical protein
VLLLQLPARPFNQQAQKYTTQQQQQQQQQGFITTTIVMMLQVGTKTNTNKSSAHFL